MRPDDRRAGDRQGNANAHDGANEGPNGAGHDGARDGTHASVHELEIQVRFGDTDALGHVNNAAFATYAELGRIALLRSVSWDEGGPILARIAIDFRAQVRLGSHVVVTTAVTRIGRSSIGLHQEVLADGACAASIDSVVVWFDYDAQRPVPVPDHVRSVLQGSGGADA